MCVMSNKQSIEVELTEKQIEYIDGIVERFMLPDRSKAIRCLVNFPRDEKSEEERVFGEIRCLDC